MEEKEDFNVKFQNICNQLAFLCDEFNMRGGYCFTADEGKEWQYLITLMQIPKISEKKDDSANPPTA